MSTYLYLGPYVECTVPTVTEDITVRGCPNASCKKGKPKDTWGNVKSKFCDSCGAEVTDMTIQRSRHISHFDVLPDDVLTELHVGETADGSWRDKLYMGPNHRCPIRKLNLDDAYDHHIDIMTLDPEKELAWFKEEYKDALDKMREAFLDVQVKWGFHYYFN